MEKNNSSLKTEFLLYRTSNDDIKVDVLLQNIFDSEELNDKVVVSILEIPTAHGAIEGKTQRKQVQYYNLDSIIAEGLQK